jgi:hypothetical protein
METATRACTRIARCIGVFAIASVAGLGCSDSGKPSEASGPAQAGDPNQSGTGSSSGASAGAVAQGGSGGPAGGQATGGAAATGAAASSAEGGRGGNGGAEAAGSDAGGVPPGTHAINCSPRSAVGDARVHFHHIHFNTVDPDADIEFFEMFFGAAGVDFCNDEQSVTRATMTDRGYFLYTEVEAAPDPTLNTYLEHVGWLNADPTGEIQRLAALGAPFYPEGRFQCPEAAMGQSPCLTSFGSVPYWFYLLAPSGARIEIAIGPGPATSGFGHVHLIMGDDLTFFETATGGAFADGAIDMVNHTDVTLMESVLENETVVETRGKPIDHIGYSTIDLEAERDRVLAAGLTIAEDISFKPSYGFRSFFMKSPKGIWIELVEDSPFAPQ